MTSSDESRRRFLTAVTEEYASLDSLKVRIAAHQELSEFPDDVEAAVLEGAECSHGHDVVDVGCGTAGFLRTRSGAGHRGRLVGVDTAPSAVEAARSVPGAEGILGSATELPLPDEAFDLLYARHMLYHVDDPAKALAEFRRVLRPGGTAVTVVNHAKVVPHATGMVREEIARQGLDPGLRTVNGIHSDNLPPLLEAAFGNVRTTRYDNSLVFSEPGRLVEFSIALLSMCGLPSEAPERPAVVSALHDRIHAWFAGNRGPWRDPKGYTVSVSVRTDS